MFEYSREYTRVHVRVLACTRASTRVCVCVCEYSRATCARHARVVKLLVSGTVHVTLHFTLIHSSAEVKPQVIKVYTVASTNSGGHKTAETCTC